MVPPPRQRRLTRRTAGPAALTTEGCGVSCVSATIRSQLDVQRLQVTGQARTLTRMTQAPGPVDPRSALWKEGDIWVAIGKPMSGIGAIKVRLNDEYLFFEKGTLRTDAQQIPIASITDVDSAQSMTQKARKVGSIRVHVHRPSGQREIVLLEDIPEFREGVQQINQAARGARQAEQQRRNTQHVNYNGQPAHQQHQAPPPPAPAQPAADPSDAIFAQLEKLGALRDKGFITEADFDQKKTELLSRL